MNKTLISSRHLKEIQYIRSRYTKWYNDNNFHFNLNLRSHHTFNIREKDKKNEKEIWFKGIKNKLKRNHRLCKENHILILTISGIETTNAMKWIEIKQMPFELLAFCCNTSLKSVSVLNRNMLLLIMNHYRMSNWVYAFKMRNIQKKLSLFFVPSSGFYCISQISLGSIRWKKCHWEILATQEEINRTNIFKPKSE